MCASTFMSSILLVSSCLGAHICALSLLSIRRSQLDPYIANNEDEAVQKFPRVSVRIVQLIGLLSAGLTLIAPYRLNINDPLQACGIRVVAFFYACKLLDLTLTKVVTPPTLLLTKPNDSGKKCPSPLNNMRDHARYVWHMLSEMRYHSFDIAVTKKSRPRPSPAGGLYNNTPADAVPLVLVPIVTYAVPTAETKCLFLLIIIQHGLEGLHSLLHWRCPHRLFYRPFAASSFSGFWTVHWHAGAASFLNSLAYRPGRKLAGKWLGVLMAFGLSGVWHAWATVPLVESGGEWLVGLKVWSFFMLMGVGCLAEQLVWGENQGGWIQWFVVWIVSVACAGWCLRSLEERSRVAWLRPSAIDQ